FALLYPWHTPLFAMQGFAGGALATWLVRCCESGWAPTLFLAAAYTTHVVLPFVGGFGVAGAAALLAGQVAFALRGGDVPASRQTPEPERAPVENRTLARPDGCEAGPTCVLVPHRRRVGGR